MSRFSYNLLAAAAVIALAVPTTAPQAGDLGESSTDTSEITLTIPELVQITGVPATVSLEPTTLTEDFHSSPQSVCVFSNVEDNLYTLKVNEGSDFVLTGASGSLSYKVDFSDGETTESDLTAGEEYTFTGGDTLPCGTSNASFTITVADTELQSVPAGAYAGDLTLLVSPAEGTAN